MAHSACYINSPHKSVRCASFSIVYSRCHFSHRCIYSEQSTHIFCPFGIQLEIDTCTNQAKAAKRKRRQPTNDSNDGTGTANELREDATRTDNREIAAQSTGIRLYDTYFRLPIEPSYTLWANYGEQRNAQIYTDPFGARATQWMQPHGLVRDERERCVNDPTIVAHSLLWKHTRSECAKSSGVISSF